MIGRLTAGLQRFFDAHVRPAPPSFSKSLGVGLAFALLLQVLTGIALGASYAPTPTDAWGSLYILETRTLLGSFVRGLHHFGASAVVVLSALHMTQVVLTGAYRRPRSRNWILGVVMLLLVLGLALTGYLLPWDQHGYWSTRVATGIIGEVPMGGLLQTLLLGGEDYGNATLSRFFALHTYVLPGLLGLLTLVHVASYLRHGPRARPTPAPRPALPYFPHQAVRDLTLMLLVFATLAALALLLGAPLQAPADPSSDYQARPEWYFLFLYQLLQFFEGPLLIIGTAVLPTLAALFLFALPFIDRRRAEADTPSRLVKLGYLGLVAALGTLTAVALARDLSDDDFQKARLEARTDAARAIALADRGGVDGLGRVILLEGLHLYHDKGCASCHDDPAVPAPRLSGYGTLERAAAFLADPDGERFFKGTALEGEMSGTGLSAEDNLAIAGWLACGGDVEHTICGDPTRLERGRRLFLSEDCTTCHNDPTMSPRHRAFDFRSTGPDLTDWLSYEWTRALVRDATHPRFFGDALVDKDLPDAMPPYPDLTPDELDLLTTWLLAGAPEAEL